MDNFCAVPFLTLSTLADGSIIPCCWHTGDKAKYYRKDDGTFFNINFDPIPEIISSQFAKNIKNEFLTNGAHFEECQKTCFSTEKAGSPSKRKMIFDLLNIDEDSTINDIILGKIKFPRLIEVKISNICNLRCVTCSPRHSSSIMAHYEPKNQEQQLVLDQAKKSFKIYTETKAKIFLDSIIDNLQDIQLLEFYGGEPFMIYDHKKFLAEIIKAGYASKISLAYTTNGTKYDSDYLEIFKHFKHVSITISIDAFGELNEKIRIGSSWEEIEANLKKYISMRDSKIISALNINSTISSNSLFGIFELIQYLDSVDKSLTMTLSILLNPSWLKIETMDKSELERWIYLFSFIDPEKTRFYLQLNTIYERIKEHLA